MTSIRGVESPMESTLEVCSNENHRELLKKLANSKEHHIEKDSGVGLQGKFQESYDPINDNFSVSRRSSACSSGCPSMPTTASPNSTVSSAYCSAASSCCDSDARSRRKSDVTARPQLYSARNFSRAPYHSSAVPFPSATVDCKPNTTAVPCATPTRRRSLAASSTSTKSERVSLSEDARRLRDSANNRTFEKKRLLGKGGFAKVYEVVQLEQSGENKTTAQAACASKIIDKSRISRLQQREKVDIEIELMAEARGHPNVVSYIDSFEDENCVCILMELCNKKSLAQYLRRKQYLSEPEVCDIMQQIVSGLAHLHGKGIIHRDLKLGNILLSDNMQVKIGDFGLATRVEWGKKKTICGTPNFIAPEVLQRQGHGPEADIWALGCLLYTLVVGKPPFETACLKETYRCILKNSYRIPTTVSPEVADLVRWMLRHKPKSRPTISEISSHAFFKKHSDYLLSVRRPLPTHQFSVAPPQVNKNDFAVNADVSSTSFPSEEKSLTTVGSRIENISSEKCGLPADKLCANCNKSKDVRSPVKILTSRLQKKLSKVASPRKCVQVATTGFREGRKTSTTSKPDLTPLKEKTPFRPTNSNQAAKLISSDNATACKTWISKWVDYSNRYGFGYQLASGRMCVLFNDGKHISMLPSGKNMEYASNENAKCIHFSVDAVPPCLTKYGAILKNFTTYMVDNLGQPSGVSTVEKESDNTRLLTWCRTDDFVAMYLSDGTLQVNFCHDHVKVNISNLHKRSTMRITVVDAACNCKTYTRDEFLVKADRELAERLFPIHRQFHSFFADVDCEQHPFCKLCLDLGCP